MKDGFENTNYDFIEVRRMASFATQVAARLTGSNLHEVDRAPDYEQRAVRLGALGLVIAFLVSILSWTVALAIAGAIRSGSRPTLFSRGWSSTRSTVRCFGPVGTPSACARPSCAGSLFRARLVAAPGSGGSSPS